jgi:glycosyltransferase involved in cell wall biosynthesis
MVSNGRRVLILVENLPVPFDRRVWMEATALRDAGFHVTVICPRSGKYRRLHEVLEGITIYRYPLPSLDGLAGHLLEYGIAVPMTFLLSLIAYVRRGFDVIQSANPPDFFFLVALFYKPFGVKFVFDHHDLVPETCETRWTGLKLKLIRGFSLWAERLTFATADRVISTNESYRGVAMERGGLPPERVSVVRSGPSLQKFKAVAPQPQLKSGRDYLVCYLGVMGPNDGLDLLLHSIEHVVVRRGRRDIQFVLIGGGDMLRLLRVLARELAIEPYVRFTDRIPDDEVIALLSTADVCVAPDPKDPLNDVSTMNKIVEYMALGKPLVAFDLREARVSADGAADYAAPNDPKDFGERILSLLGDPARREQMGRDGRMRFEQVLAWEHQRTNLIGLYSDLLQSS